MLGVKLVHNSARLQIEWLETVRYYFIKSGGFVNMLGIKYQGIQLSPSIIVGGVSNPDFCCWVSQIEVRNPSYKCESRQLNAPGFEWVLR